MHGTVCMQQHNLTVRCSSVNVLVCVDICICASNMLLYSSVLYVQRVARCKVFGMQFSTVVKSLISVYTGIYNATFPAVTALVLLITLSLVLTVLHLPQLLYSISVCICALCVSGRNKVKEVIIVLFPPTVPVLSKISLLQE